jgi:hypothetical protein
MADSNRADFAFVEEVTWGTTPASALQTLRITGESLADQEETAESAEILSDRNLGGVIRLGRFSQGDLNFELSAGTLDTLLQGVLCDTWASNVLENGTTKRSFTFEKKIAVDGSPAAHYFAFKGCRLDTLALTLARGAVITGTIGIIGKAGVGGAVTAGSGAYSAAGVTEPLSAVDLTTLTEASVSPGSVVEVTLNLTNNLRRQMALGSADPIGYGYGGFRASGALALYFANRTLYDKYVAETQTELEFAIEDAASKSYTFTVPKARWGTPEIVIAGVNDDILARFPWTAVKDATTGSSISITRVP